MIINGTLSVMATTWSANVPALPYPPMSMSTLSVSTALVTGVTALGPGASFTVSATIKVMLTLVFQPDT